MSNSPYQLLNIIFNCRIFFECFRIKFNYLMVPLQIFFKYLDMIKDLILSTSIITSMTAGIGISLIFQKWHFFTSVVSYFCFILLNILQGSCTNHVDSKGGGGLAKCPRLSMQGGRGHCAMKPTVMLKQKNPEFSRLLS